MIQSISASPHMFPDAAPLRRRVDGASLLPRSQRRSEVQLSAENEPIPFPLPFLSSLPPMISFTPNFFCDVIKHLRSSEPWDSPGKCAEDMLLHCRLKWPPRGGVWRPKWYFTPQWLSDTFSSTTIRVRIRWQISRGQTSTKQHYPIITGSSHRNS